MHIEEAWQDQEARRVDFLGAGVRQRRADGCDEAVAYCDVCHLIKVQRGVDHTATPNHEVVVGLEGVQAPREGGRANGGGSDKLASIQHL